MMEPVTATSPYNRFCKFAAVTCLLIILFAFRKAEADLFTAWQTNEYSHGIIIPFISLLIAWHCLTAVRPNIQPSWWGAGVLLVSASLLMVSMLAAFQIAAEYGLILTPVALSLAFLGTAATRTMAPAFIYLFFAVPLPNLVYANLSQDLQLISSTLGVWCLDLLGIPVFQEGNVIDLGGYKLQVVEACSGLRYLFPLVSFGYLVAYLFEDRLWKRMIIFFSAIPITIGMNSLRIALIGITVNLWGQEMAEGFVHQFEGWVIFLFCVALLMGEVRLLLNVGTRGTFHFEVFSLAHGPLFSGFPRFSGPVVAALALSLATLLGSSILDKRTEIIPDHPPFSSFPVTLDKWHGSPSALEADVLQGLQLSDYWLADYNNDSDKAAVNFYIAYYASQRVGSSTHSPSSCIPGGGWEIVSRTVKNISLNSGESMGKSIQVSRMFIRRRGISQLVYFWFDERGRNITETHYAKWYLLLDSITMHRTDGALIRVVTKIPDGESEEDAEKRLNNFLSISYPVIKTFVPGEILPPSETHN